MRGLPILIGIILLGHSLYAQTSYLGVRAGLCNLRGELTENISENYGADLSVHYNSLFLNSPWMFTAEISHSQAFLKHNFVEDQTYSCTFGQTYLGAGFKFTVNQQIMRRPKAGQFFPFAGFGFGLTQTTISNINHPPSGGYEIADGTIVDAAIQLEVGAMLRLTKQWSIEGYFITRTSGSDDWDSVIGTGKWKDWLIRGGVGLTYMFRR